MNIFAWLCGWRKKKTDSGLWGEAQAEQFLRKSGYKFIGRRVRFGSRSELDLVMRDGQVLVFVEVKTRATEQFGRPSDFVDRRKRHFLSRAAMRYIRRIKPPEATFRFDVVEVVGSPQSGVRDIRHVQAAFPLDRMYYPRV